MAINWNNQQPLTADAARLAVSTMGNVANGFQALGANINAGLDREIARRELIEAKNRASNTQLLINQMSQAKSLEDLQAMEASGAANLGRMRAVLGSDFDERAYNQALAQREEMVNNKFLARDSLKLSTPEGRAALLQANVGLATNDPSKVVAALNSGNLPMSTWGAFASGASQTSRQNIAEDHYNEQAAATRQQYFDAQKTIERSQEISRQQTALQTAVTAGNNDAKFLSSMAQVMQKHGFPAGGENEVHYILTHPNEFDGVTLERAKAARAESEIPLGRRGTTWDDFVTNPDEYSPQRAITGGFPKSQPVAGSMQPDVSMNRQALINSDNPGNSGSGVGIFTSNALNNGNNSNSISARLRQARGNISPSSQAQMSLIDESNRPTYHNGAYTAQLGALSAVMKEWGTDIDLTNGAIASSSGSGKNNQDPTVAATQRYLSTRTPQQRALMVQRAKELQDYQQAPVRDFDSRVNIGLSGTKVLPLSQLFNHQPDGKEKEQIDYATKLAVSDPDAAKRYIRETLFKNDATIADKWTPAFTNWAFRDRASELLVQAIRDNKGSQHIMQMAIPMITAIRNQNGTTNNNVTNPGADSSAAADIIAGIQALSQINNKQVTDMRNEYRQVKASAQLPPEAVTNYLLNDSYLEMTPEEFVTKYGTPAWKAQQTRQDSERLRQRVVQGSSRMENSRRNAQKFGDLGMPYLGRIRTP